MRIKIICGEDRYVEALWEESNEKMCKENGVVYVCALHSRYTQTEREENGDDDDADGKN